jgi:hypothetical protein
VSHDEAQVGSDAKADEALLLEIRKRWEYASDAWREIREEGATDMRYVAGDPWDPTDRQARLDANRPCLSLDELGQYVNQVINDVRQNSRAIRVTPIGDGATDESAEFRANLIRQIEYRSNAQMAYTTTFENAVQRSFGFHRVKAQYVSDSGFDQELRIEPMPNPDDVTPDPDSIKTDGSDWRYCFVRESRTHDEFKREFPTARVTSFDSDMIASAPQWVSESKVWLAEYWTKVVKKRELLLLRVTVPGQGPAEQVVFADTLEAKPSKANILKRREVDEVSVVQYLTNGVEILKTTAWPGKSIPIIPCYGKVMYVDDGGGSKRRILSMVRLARDPYMLYCFYRTTEAELVSMTPKTPAMGYTGQFRGHETEWQKANHVPVAFLEANPTTEKTGQTVLPLPTRQPYDPPIQALEIGAEAARRAIQAAMGIAPLPTSAQRRNEKSGVALKQIEDSAQKGSFHFIDHYDEAIARTGVIVDELIPFYYDTAREVTVRKPDDTAQQVRINDPSAPAPGTQQPIDATAGQHDVTIATGPSYDSEREAASDFADLLVQNPQVFPIIAPLVVKLKNLGPIGDQLAELLTVMQPPEARAIMEKGEGRGPDPVQLQQQLAQAMEQLELMKGELEAKTRAIETDQVKAQAQVQLEEVKQQGVGAVKIAEIEASAETEGAKLAIEQERLELERFKLDLEAAKVELERRKLEVTLEIEMAKLGSARSMARAELEQEDLHHHDETQLREQERLTAETQADLDRQAAADAASAKAEGGEGENASV